jgi:hypothetical protein
MPSAAGFLDASASISDIPSKPPVPEIVTQRTFAGMFQRILCESGREDKSNSVQAALAGRERRRAVA